MPRSRQTHSTAHPDRLPNRRSRRTAEVSSGPSTDATAEAHSTTGRSTPGHEHRRAQEEMALLGRVRQRLGIAALLSYHRATVPIDRLVVRDVTRRCARTRIGERTRLAARLTCVPRATRYEGLTIDFDRVRTGLPRRGRWTLHSVALPSGLFGKQP